MRPGAWDALACDQRLMEMMEIAAAALRASLGRAFAAAGRTDMVRRNLEVYRELGERTMRAKPLEPIHASIPLERLDA